MSVINYSPTSAGRRFMSGWNHSEDLSKDVKPLRKLLVATHKRQGRNNQGRISVRRRGGGGKRFYRTIDFKREKTDVRGKVHSIQYDPNRSAYIALIVYEDGEKRYIIAPKDIKIGQVLTSGKEADIIPGNALSLQNIPTGTTIHNIELKPGAGAQIVRSAGTSAQLIAKEGKYAQIRLPSGEVRKVLLECKASIGQVGKTDHENICLGKAGRSRWLGRRPKVRGVAMNPVDHPHGGGEGKTSGGRHPVTPWGKGTKGKKTRNNARTEQFILKKRR